jgi:hypothetical protein
MSENHKYRYSVTIQTDDLAALGWPPDPIGVLKSNPGGSGFGQQAGHLTEESESVSRSRPTPAWQPREQVISFRISKDHAAAMERFFWDNAMAGVNSVNKLARKIALDFIEGRLRYDNPRGAEVDWGIFVRKAKRSSPTSADASIT